MRKSHFEQAVWMPPISRLGLDTHRSRPAPLTDSCGRGHRCQRHGGVFVRVCGTGCGGQCLIEAPHLIIVPSFWGSECAARRGGASGAGNAGARRHHPVPARTVAVCGWLFIDSAIVACILAFFFRVWRVGWSQTDGRNGLEKWPCVIKRVCLWVTLEPVRWLLESPP